MADDTHRRAWSALLALPLLTSLSLAAGAETPAIQVHGPAGDTKVASQLTLDQIAFRSTQGRPGVSSAVIVGDPGEAGLYVVFVRLAEGAKIPPHTHPDGRVTTVVQGQVLFGLGETLDPSRAKLYGPGSVYYTPPNVPHYLIGAGADLVYQEVGMGPSASVPVGPK